MPGMAACAPVTIISAIEGASTRVRLPRNVAALADLDLLS